MIRRLALASVQVPFVQGGAEYLAQGLLQACRHAGYQADLITLPFSYTDAPGMQQQMHAWAQMDFTQLNGVDPDLVICLKFPAWYLQHPVKVAWILHQHRPMYDLWERLYPEPSPQDIELKQQIETWDQQALKQCLHLFTISKNVSQRLHTSCGLDASPIYHPSPLADALYTAPSEGFIFAPSRLEPLKRQALLIEAAAQVPHPPQIRIAGTGTQAQALAALIEKYGLQDKVKLLGELSQAEMLAHYAHASAVYFAPYDEDYGYVTLEALGAAKPVITCSDSGGPLEFIQHQVNGWICPPDAQALALALAQVQANPSWCARLGQQGYDMYQALNLSWDQVLFELIQ